MSTLIQDARYALRAFLRTPGFTLAAVLSLGIGIGATTAIFSVAHALLLRPLPYTDPERLAILWNRSPGLNIAEDWFSTAQYFDIKRGHSGFEEVAIALGANYNLTGDGPPERIGVIRVSSNLLPMLGVRPALGRLFVAAEDAPGQPNAALLSHGTWTRRFGNDPQVTTKSVILNGQTYAIAGVLPASFSLPREVLPTLGVVDDGEILLPLPLAESAAANRGREDYNVMARLKPGVAVERAQAEMDTITARLRTDYPDLYPPNGGLTFSVVSLLEQVVGDVRRPLLILAGAVGFVLLIACANVANLLLSRALGRQKEIALRASLGASRARILRQLLTESVALALAGGILGVLFAWASVGAIHALQPDNVPRLQDIAVNPPVLLFTLIVAIASGTVFGLAPALGLGRIDLHTTLKDTGRGSSSAHALWGRGNHLRRLLVIAELALAVVLLVGAGLLIRSFAHLQRVPPGFNPHGVLTLELTMTGRKYADGKAVQLAYKDLWTRLDALPGVSASGGVTSLPMSNLFAWGPITVEGRVPPPGEKFINTDIRVASGRYFEAMAIPLLKGRLFEERDTPDQPRVVIVDAFMAEQLWPGLDPIGRRIRFGDQNSTAPWQTVVGVVGRVKQYGLHTDGRIAMYYPHTQSPSRALFVTVRSAGDPASLAITVGQQIRELDPDLPIYRVQTMAARVDRSLGRQRFSMLLLSLFAAVAALLATIGIYGVMAYLVTQGTREIGIRLALGASQQAILGLVLRQGLLVAAVGLALGLAGAFALTRLMRTLLFGVQPTDPATFVAIAAALALVAAVASFVPARRATRIDPMTSLRTE